MKETKRYDYGYVDDMRSARRLKRKGLDDAFEINVGRPTLKKSVEELNMGKPSIDEDYLMFLKSVLLKREPSSSHGEEDENREEDDWDPQYMMFLKNLRKYGGSYKLEIGTKKRRVSVIYEAENDSNENCGMQSLVRLKKTLKKENAEAEDKKICNDARRVRCNVMQTKHLKSKAAKYNENSQTREKIGMRNRPRMYNNVMDSGKILTTKRERETHNAAKRDLKSRVVKDLTNPPRRMEMKPHKKLRSGGSKHVEFTKIDMGNNRGREKERRVKKDLKSKYSKHTNHDQAKTHEAKKDLKFKYSKHTNNDQAKTHEAKKDLKSKYSKHTNHDQAKTHEASGQIHKEKWNSVFGCDWQQQLNADDIDDSYRIFMSSIKIIEGDYVVYTVQGKKPVKLEQFDKLEQSNVECSSDSEIFVTSNASDLNEGGCNPFQISKLSATPENKQFCLGSRDGDNDSGFRKKLMSKLGEPYNHEEYEELWDEFHQERPKVKHIDLRGSAADKQLVCDELGPSYRTTYAPVGRKLLAVGHNRSKRLKLLRGFFFWLQNLAHDDAFPPWFDKSCLEMMRK